MMTKAPFAPDHLPLEENRINQLTFLRELIEANKKIV